MATVALCLFGMLVGSGLLQWALTLRVTQLLKRKPPPLPQIERWPAASVVLSLRGQDAYLTQCLHGLLQQDYPAYTVHIVVDSKHDPAWRTAEQVIAEHGATHVSVSPLKLKRQTCSLKCSALVQAVSELDPSQEVVAFIDADVVPHPTWLRELVAPLATEPRVGAVTGNRWYLPGHVFWGSAVRSAWCAAALVQMFLFKIAWGGSLAIRTATLRDSRVVEKWSLSFNDDVLIGDLVRDLGLTLRFVPSLIMVNTEETPFPSLVPWITRQLVHVRFYHRGWPLLVVFGLMITLLMPAAMLGSLVAAAMGDFASVGWMLLGCLSYMAIMLPLYLMLQRCTAIIAGRRGVPLPPRGTLVRLGVGVFLTHLIYALSLVGAMFRRTVDWRGVTYRIRGPWQVELLEYRPYQPVAPAVDASLSI